MEIGHFIIILKGYRQHEIMRPHNSIADLKFLTMEAAILLFRRFVLAVCCLLLVGKADAQLVYTDKGLPASRDMLKEIHRKAVSVKNEYQSKGVKCERIDILDIRDNIYLLPDGTFDVYQWKDGDWINLYSGSFVGYNFNSYKFVLDGKIYSSGGDGYWQDHGQIITFLWDRGEWEILPFSLDLERNHVYCDGESLVSFWGLPIKIDPGNKKVESLPPFNYEAELNMNNIFYRLDFSNYIYIRGRWFYFLEKRSGELRRSTIECIGKIQKAKTEDHLFHIIGDSLTIYNHDAEIFLATNVNAELYKFDKVPGSRSSSPVMAWGFGILAVLILGFGLYRAKILINKTGNDSTMDDPLFSVLSAHRGKIMTMEDFDVILGIDKVIPAETQRFRRAQLIKSLNRKYRAKHGHNLIERQRDPEDGRRYMYRVV